MGIVMQYVSQLHAHLLSRIVIACDFGEKTETEIESQVGTDSSATTSLTLFSWILTFVQ